MFSFEKTVFACWDNKLDLDNLTSLQSESVPKEKPIHELSVGRIHAKLRELFEKTGTCELCGKERFMRVSAYPYREPATEFAYKFHPEPYTLHREDYYEACSFCHVRFDALNRRKRKEV